MATDNSKLAFTSKFRYEEVALHGHVTFSVTVAEFYKEFVINHNLGYIPFFRLWYDFGDSRIFEMFAGPTSYDVAGNGAQVDNISVDASKITIGMDNFSFGPGATIAGNIYYRIYKEQVA